MTTLKRQVASAARYVIGEKNKKVLQHTSLQIKSYLGKPPFTGWNGLDEKLLPYLKKHPGFFIEAGANDGFSQSNTYYLEKRLNWRGVLVEPIGELAALARRFRRSAVYECALGGPQHEGATIELCFSDLTSRSEGTESIRWNGIFGRNPKTSKATIRTLSSIIEQAGNPEIDLFVLDVEGHELEALDGLDLARHRPRHILMETSQPDAVSGRLATDYVIIAQLSHHDYLFERTH